MIVTVVGIVSIALGFACVMAAYYFFQREIQAEIRHTRSLIFGLLGLVFLTIIPATSAVFFAATHGG